MWKVGPDRKEVRNRLKKEEIRDREDKERLEQVEQVRLETWGKDSSCCKREEDEEKGTLYESQKSVLSTKRN